jgi:hypothetical protein
MTSVLHSSSARQLSISTVVLSSFLLSLVMTSRARMDEDLPTRGLRKANCFDRVTTRTAREDDDGDAEDERLAAAARTATGATMPRDTAPTTIPKRDDGDLRALTATNYSCKMTSSS